MVRGCEAHRTQGAERSVTPRYDSHTLHSFKLRRRDETDEPGKANSIWRQSLHVHSVSGDEPTEIPPKARYGERRRSFQLFTVVPRLAMPGHAFVPSGPRFRAFLGKGSVRWCVPAGLQKLGHVKHVRQEPVGKDWLRWGPC